MTELANLQVVVGIDSTAAERGLDAFGTKVGGVGSAIQSALGAAAVGAVVGIGAAFVGSVKSAADFEKGLSAISAVSGATKEELEGIRQTALQLGKDTSFSAAESAAGMEEMIKAGVSLADVMNGAGRAALDLAAAGGLAVPEAAALMSNAINIFKKDNLSAAESADIISQAANASAISVHDFGFSLSAVGAVAATIGFTLQDTATAIAVLGQNGLKGSDAGTSLKTMLLNLSPASKAARAQMRELGLITADGANQFFDASGKAKDWAQIAGLLQDSLKGLTKEQQVNALQTMFGTDAVRAAAIMADVGTEGINKMAEAEKNAGTARSVAAQRLNNLSGSFETFMGSVETGAIILGSMFTPALKGMADAATEHVNTAINVLEQIPDVIGTIQQVLAGDWAPDSSIHPFTNAVGEAVSVLRDTFGPAITVVGGFLQQIGEWFTAAIAPIAAFVAGFLGVIGTAGLVSAAVGAIVAVLGFLITPLAAVAIAAGLLAAAWTTNFIGIRDIVTKVLGGDLKGAFTLFVTNVTAVSQQIGTALLGWGQAFVAWVAPMIPLMLAALGKLVLDTVSWIVVQAGQFIAALLTWATAFIAWVTPIVPQLLTELGLLLLGVVGWIATVALPAIVTQLMAWATAFWGWVLPAIPPLLAALAGLALAVGGWIATVALPAIVTQLGLWATAFWQWVGTAVPPLLTALGALLVSLGTWVVGTALPSLVTSLVQWELAFMQWVVNAGPPMLAELATLLASTTAWLVGAALAALVQSIVTWATAFKTWVSPAGVAMLGEMASTMLVPMVTWITGAAASSITAGLGTWTLAFVAWAKTIWPGIQAEITAIPGRVIAALATLPALVGALGVQMIQAFIKGWLSVAIPMPSLPSFGGGGGGATPQSYSGGGGASSGGGATPQSYSPANGGGGTGAIVAGRGGQVNQYNLGLSPAEADAACGPAALAWFMNMNGRLPTGAEALRLAKSAGWDAGRGMYGPGAFQNAAAAGGVQTRMAGRGDIAALAASGQPFAISTTGHYFQVSGGDPRTGLNVGGSGEALRGGSAVMTLAQIEALMGPVNGVIVPQVAAPKTSSPRIEPQTGVLPGDQFPRIPLSGGAGVDPSQWPGFMQQVDEQLPDYLLSLDTIRQSGTLAFNGTAQSGAVAADFLVSASRDGLGNVSRIYTDGTGAVMRTLEDSTGQIVSTWTGGWTAIGAGTTAGTDFLVSASTDAAGNVTRIYSGMSGEITKTVFDAAGNLVGTWGTIGAGAGVASATMATAVVANTNLMANGALVSVTNLGTGILTSVTDSAGTTIATVTDMQGQVTSQYATLANGVSLTMGDMAAGVMTSTTDLGTGVMTIVQDTSGNYIATITDMAGNVTSQYTSLGTEVAATTATMNTEVSAETAEMATNAVSRVTDLSDGVLTISEGMADHLVIMVTEMVGQVVNSYTTMGADVTVSVEEMASTVVEQYGEIAAEAESSTQPVEDFYAAAAQELDLDFSGAIKEFEKLAKAAKKAADAVEEVSGKGGKKGGGDDDDPFGRDSGERGDFGESAAYGGDITPLRALAAASGGLPERHVIAIEIGGRIAEEIYIQGRELAITRGRVPSGAS